ncbi:MAG: glycoside hydrolase family 28 protein [Puniceicoccaceae bacterium]
MNNKQLITGLTGLFLAMLSCHGADFNVLDHGATGDGETLDTAAIHAAIDACSEAGGGRVVVPAGRYLTGSIHLEDNVNLYLAGGAELLYSGDPEDSPLVQTRWEGTRVYTHGPLIYANGKKNISVTGRGRINGQGVNWWWRNTEDPARVHISQPAKDAWLALFKRIQAGEPFEKADFELPSKFLRPSLVVFYECENVLVEGVTLLDSPMWMLHPIFCENVLINGVSFVSYGPNGDGIDIDSCRNVRVSDCYFDTEDDCIVIKSGRDADGRRVGRASEFITITNCVMYRGHGAVVIGSEMSGGVRDVSASNIVCFGTDRGIRLKTARGRGGVVENLRFDNWVIHDSPQEAIQISSNYVDLPEEPFTERTPTMRNVSISNVTVNGARTVINIGGLAEQPIEGLRFSDIRGRGQAGMVCNLARDVEVHDVRIDAEEGPAFFFSDVEDIHLDNVGTRTSRREPVIALHNARNVWLHDSLAVRGNRTFVQVQGAASNGIIMSGNELSAATKSVILGPDVHPEAVRED